MYRSQASMTAESSTFADSASIKRCRDEVPSFVDDKRWRHDVSGSFTDKQWRHDVFMSFRGEDTRRNFTSHLFHCLKEKGLNVFIDDGLPRGEDISQQLIDTIRSSRISVVVFSRNYSDSKWCLEELSEIMECRKTHKQMVLPVFYDVDPSDVRKQKGHFGDVFVAKHQTDKNIARWRAVLAEAGSLSGWDITNAVNGTEAKIVRKIASRICDELNNTYLDVAKFPVGLETRILRVNDYLNDGSEDVRFIVIWGPGGIGKTTLAKAVYNQFFHSFEAKSFLANIGENSKQPDGMIHLQEQILQDILKFQKVRVGSIDRGINDIKERLRTRRVLVVLDDLSHRDQLKALAREREWFGPGSRIIITTRDLDSVKEIDADYLYSLDPLSYDESMQLFSLCAFRRCDPTEEFLEQSIAAVGYCEGVPLALEVLGSFFRNLPAEEWKSALDQLRREPHGDIQQKLEISYYSLRSDTDKKLFLDIACFFCGWNKDRVVRILEACDISVELGLRSLTRRSLVTITKNQLMMHDVVRDMGREIVRKESPENPGKRSRLFSQRDILTTLRNHLGSKKVKGLMLSGMNSTAEVDAKAFAKMKQLSLLQLKNLHVKGDFGIFPRELRWLHWHGFPLNFLPDDLCIENVVVIDIQYSKLQATWKTSKFMGQLKVLNLSHSYLLTKTPNFSNLPSLEELIMEDCTVLKELHPSIGCLKGLVLMNFKGCRKLGFIPDSICGVKSLQVLDIRGCSKISQLPKNIGELESLTDFLADGAPITHLPPSFASLKKLSTLSFQGYKSPASSSSTYTLISWGMALKWKANGHDNNMLNIPFSGLSSLTGLRLRDCDLLDNACLESLGCLLSLKYLDLTGSQFYGLPGSVSSLCNLLEVSVRDCPNLEFIPEMPPSVRRVIFTDCARLSELPCSQDWGPEVHLELAGCKNISAKCKESILKDWKGKSLLILGNDVPNWFEHQSRSFPLSFRMPTCRECRLKRIIVCCVGGTPDNHSSGGVLVYPVWFLNSSITSRNKDHLQKGSWSPRFYSPNEDHISILSVTPSDAMGDIDYRGIQVTLSAAMHTVHKDWIIKGIGVHLEQERCQSCRINGVIGSETTSSGPPVTSHNQEQLRLHLSLFMSNPFHFKKLYDHRTGNTWQVNGELMDVTKLEMIYGENPKWNRPLPFKLKIT